MKKGILSGRTLLALVFVGCLASRAYADDFPVAPGGSIQAAIDAASDGDRVLVAAGTYNESIDFLGKAITVIGLGGALATTIDATGIGGPVVVCTSGEGAGSVLVGFTLTGGNVVSFFQAGAGINAWDSGIATSPTVMDCIVRDNTANSTFGGGIAGNPTLVRCSIYGNQAGGGEGGGIYGAPQMSFCVVADNFVSDGAGGGLHVNGGTSLVEDCVFVENTSVFTGAGGGVYVSSGASVTLRRCLILANTADAGIMTQSRGGAVRVAGGGTGVVDSCTVVDNVAGEYCCGTSWGGLSGVGTITNSIVRGNSFLNISGLVNVSYSNVGGGYFGTGNIDADPLFVNTARRDYHLEEASPSVDTGNLAALDPDGSRLDMGAFFQRNLYDAANATAALWSDPGWPQVPARIGGRQVLRANLPPLGMPRTYLALGTTSGISPGTTVARVPVPLNRDAYFHDTLYLPYSVPILRGNGWADALRTHDVSVRVPPPANLDAPELFAPGTTVHHTLVLLSGMTAVRPARLQPLVLDPVLLAIE